MKNITILINGHPNSGKSTMVETLKIDLVQYKEFFTFDYDGNFIKAANICKPDDKECFRGAKIKILSGIKEASKKVNMVSDLLLTSKEVGTLKYSIRNDNVDVIAIRLSCNQNVREKRDKDRRKKNPNAPYGFNDSLNPLPNPIVYDLEIDTSTKTVKVVCNEITAFMKSKDLL